MVESAVLIWLIWSGYGVSTRESRFLLGIRAGMGVVLGSADVIDEGGMTKLVHFIKILMLLNTVGVTYKFVGRHYAVPGGERKERRRSIETTKQRQSRTQPHSV